jgi:WD40 repeat protein
LTQLKIIPEFLKRRDLSRLTIDRAITTGVRTLTEMRCRFMAGKSLDKAVQVILVAKSKAAAMMIFFASVIGDGATLQTNGAAAGPQVGIDVSMSEQQSSAKVEEPQAGEAKQSRFDNYGDPLPEGALARMGTVRLRHYHWGPPFSTVFSPDGKMLASGGSQEIRLWDSATGKLIREIREGNRTRYCILVFAPDGSWLAGASLDSMCIWDTTTGRRLRELPANGQAVVRSPNGKLIAAPSKDGSISVWETATGKRVADLRDGQHPGVHWPTFTNDGKRLVTLLGNQVYHWDLHADKLQKKVDLAIQPNTGLILSPDGQTLAAIRPDAPISLWDAVTGQKRLTFQGKFAIAGMGITFSADGRTLATNGNNRYEAREDTRLALWDVKTGELLRCLVLPTSDVDNIVFAPDGRTLLTTGYEPLVRMWDVATGKPILQWAAHTQEIESLAFTPDGRSLVSGGLDGTVRLWEVTSGRQLRELPGHRWRCDVVAVAPNGKVILSGGADGCIRLQDQDGKQLRSILLDGPPEGRDKQGHHVLAIAMTPGGKTIVTWSHDFKNKTYDSWDLASGKRLMSRADTAAVISTPLFSLDAHLVAENLYDEQDVRPPPRAGGGGAKGAGGGGTTGPAFVGTLVREISSGREIVKLRHEEEPGSAQAFATDCRMIVTISNRQQQTVSGWRHDGAVQFWELATGNERLAIPFHFLNHWIQRAALAPDSQTLATAREDGRIEFWDASTGKQLPGQFGSDVTVRWLAFSPDSKLLASGHADGTILVWRPPAKDLRSDSSEGKAGALRLEEWWADLASADARRAYAAVCGLAREPAKTIRFLSGRLRPIFEAPSYKLRPLIADLDDPGFQRREAAAKELTALGEQAVPALRSALRVRPSAEQRRRIERILGALPGSPDVIRHVRAIEVLERIGNPNAQELLQKLASGMPEARLTREAQASLRRLTRRE